MLGLPAKPAGARFEGSFALPSRGENRENAVVQTFLASGHEAPPRALSLAARVLLLGALAGLLSCSPSDGKGAEAADPPDASSSDEDIVAYWTGLWSKGRPENPMYLRLPASVDTRGWEPMHQGFLDWRSRQKGFNRPTQDNYERNYEFSWDAFTGNIPLWRELLEPFVGKPDVRYLEIGVAEGRSFFWVLDNILTHPTSRATGIEPFMVEAHESSFHNNLKKSSGPDRARVIKGFSQDVLPGLEPDSFDLIYIDGSHLAGDVLFDAVYTWRLLRDGGVVIHDDYMHWSTGPPDIGAMVAVDAFITAMRNEVEVLHRGHQIVLRKLPLEIPASCWNADPCLRIGDYLYSWNSDKLRRVGSGETVPLSKLEREVLREILLSRRIGADAELLLEQDIASLRSSHPEAFSRLVTLMGLTITSPPLAGTATK